MGHVLLVRHGQASFLSQDYDRLSALGETQARLLGEYWVQRNVVFDRVCTGPALRHRQTAQLVAEAYRKGGVHFPAASVVDEFGEFQGDAVLSQSLPQLLGGNAKIRELHDAMQSSSTEATKRASFQRLFQAVITMWANEEITPPNLESWEEFCEGVNRGLSVFLAKGGKGELTAIFTSGGPVSVAVQRALHLSADDTLRVAWMLRNCSFSEFLYSGDRFTLSSLNSIPHLDESLLTYR